MQFLAFLARHRLALGLALPLLAAPAWGQDSAAQRAALKGVTIVEVVVEAMDPVAERDGLTRAHLQAEVELRLRQAGIPVGPTLTGHLYVNVDTLKSDHGQTYAYNVVVQYMQQVVLARAPKAPMFATTWETGGVGMIGADRLREVRQDVANYVDQFITAYLEQNPKPQTWWDRSARADESASAPNAKWPQITMEDFPKWQVRACAYGTEATMQAAIQKRLKG